MTRKNVTSPSAFGFVATSRHHGIYRPTDHAQRRRFVQVERDAPGRWNVYVATQTQGIGLDVDLRETWPTLGKALAAAMPLDKQIKKEN